MNPLLLATAILLLIIYLSKSNNCNNYGYMFNRGSNPFKNFRNADKSQSNAKVIKTLKYGAVGAAIVGDGLAGTNISSNLMSMWKL
jgi:hypothetical protein